MTAPTPTEFLLARIAEDEKGYSKAVALDLPICYECGHEAGDGYYPERLLAECEAKRRIVSLHPIKRFVPIPNTWDARDICPACHGHAYPCETLRHLAAVYADHPDYDEAWRP